MSRTISRALRALAMVLLLGTTAAAARAQERLTVPWSPLTGVYEMRDGTLTGFFAELSDAIAQRAGLTPDYRRYPNYPDTLSALAQGEGEMLAGVTRLPLLEGKVLWSEPVTETAVYLFVREEEPADTTLETLDGRPLGIVRETAGSALLPADREGGIIAYDSLAALFGALLVGQVDGVVALHKAGADFLQRSRLDYRIRIAGPPLRTETHYVALSPARAELLPRINTALEQMRADGSLGALLRRWNMIPPQPAPAVLTVGVSDFPPYQVLTADGGFTGYGVESLRDLAQRAGLSLVFRRITSEEWAAGPDDGTFDLLPPLSVTEAKRRQMDFTLPLQQSPYSIFLRSGEEGDIAGLADLGGMRVGVTALSYVNSLPEVQALDPVPFPDAEDLLDGLLDGRVDAILYATANTRRMLRARGQTEAVSAVEPPFVIPERAIGLRFGLPMVRERLNAVIPGYLSSEESIALREEWLGEPEFWTPLRVRIAQALAAGLVIAVALAFLVQARRAQRRALEQAEDMRRITTRLSAILDTTRAAILGLQRDGAIAIANPGATKMLGLGTGPWPLPWPEGIRFVDPETNALLEASANPVLRARAGASITSERAVLSRGDDTAPRWVRISSASVEAARDTDVATVLVIEDVTEQERSRQQVERADRLDALGQLTGGVAHDFNNILGTIQYAAQLAALGASDKQRKYLDTALGSVRRGEELTSRLLAFAKRQPGLHKSLPVATVLEDLRDLAGPVLEKSLVLDIATPAPELRVFCDIGQLENALLNLVLNSRDAILEHGASGRIRVRASRVADAGPPGIDMIEITVSDDGPGMSPEVQRRAIDPFFTTKSSDKGTGLGLSMVYGFVEQSNGSLVIDSEEGHGTEIRIRLPEGDELEPADTPGTLPAQLQGKGETVFIVEDEIDLLGVTSEIVANMGYRVLSAPSGRAAIERIRREAPGFDLLLTDVVMPDGIGGFELARLVRQNYPDMPVVYMSGYTGITRDSMGGEEGPVLRKPCSSAELSRTLRKALAGR